MVNWTGSFDPSNLSMRRKSSSSPVMEETVALAFAEKNLFPAEAPTAAMEEGAEIDPSSRRPTIHSPRLPLPAKLPCPARATRQREEPRGAECSRPRASGPPGDSCVGRRNRRTPQRPHSFRRDLHRSPGRLGGAGNARFATSTNQAPAMPSPAEPGSLVGCVLSSS